MRRTTCLLLLAGLLLSCGGGNQVTPTQTYYTLSVQATPSGGGSVSLSPNQTQHTAGTVVTITATPGSGYTFSHWSGDASGTSATTTVTMSGNRSVTANFTSTAQYSLALNVLPTGAGGLTKSPNLSWFNAGTVVTITATANSGYTFSNWSGDASGTSTSTTVTMNGNKTVTANFTATTTQYTLTVNVSPSGSGSVIKSPNQTTYAAGTVVTLNANAGSGYTFNHWSGDATGSNIAVQVTMNGNKTVTANYTATTTQYTLTVNASPSAGGSVTKSPNQTTYAAGTVVTLTANANSGYSFSNWSGDASGTSTSTTVTMNGNKTVTANFTPTTTQYTLTVSVSPSAGGSVTKTPNQTTYAAGPVVTLTANPASGYQFSSWSGSLTGSTNPTTITMNGNKTVTANFTAAQYTLTVNVSPSAGGSVTKSPNQTTYAAGTVVTLTESPNSGYTFSSWSGDASGTGTQTTVTMNGNKTVTANFTVQETRQPPGISAPSSTTTGTQYTVTVTYSSWPTFGSSNDRLELEESLSSTTGFSVVNNSAWGSHPTSFASNFTKSSAGTYYYRARVYRLYGGTGGYSDYSQVVSVIVSAPSGATVYATGLGGFMTSSANSTWANTAYPGQSGVGQDFTGPELYNYALTGFALQFPSTAIQGRSIAKAILRLRVQYLRGDFRYTPQIQVAALANPWNPNTLTWNAWYSMSHQTSGMFNVYAPDTGSIPFDLDVTTIVSNWASSVYPNYGIALTPTNYQFLYVVSLGTTNFYPISGSGSWAPQLLITYR